eukprot:TRINITY_DN31050_c0_g1_i1.p1 TRINITY_DN31050_c0_g1~~TRINITY_DN31050_c0_g1_i1.p1  ORF type:complete len:313 (-),score=78.63 TRINITY_DN31050_c0_g1_i1:21-959(-)
MHVGCIDIEQDDPSGYYVATVVEVKRQIQALIDAGVPAARICVGGFSQGAAVALETAMTSDIRLGGCLVLSGWMTPRARAALTKGAAGMKTPVLLCHGKKDDMVGFDCAEAAAKALQGAAVSVQFHDFPNVAHTSDPTELALVTKFLHSVLLPGKTGPEIDWVRQESDDSGSDFSSDDSGELTFVSKEALETLVGQLKNGKQMSLSCIPEIQDTSKLSDNAAMVPIKIDMITDFQELADKLGTKGASNAFMMGAEEALRDTSAHLTFQDWKEQVALPDSDAEEGEESEEMLDSEEEGSAPDSPSLPKRAKHE